MDSSQHPSAAFHAAGLYTFPVRMEEGTFRKLPLVKAWSDVHLGPKGTSAPNYGIRLSDEYIIIDVDTKRSNGREALGQQSWNKLVAYLKRPLPENQFVVGTMNGGRHYWFKKPPAMRTRYRLPKEFPNIEFLTGPGHYVVGPGTDFKHGLPYSIISGSFCDECIPQIPDEILNLIQETFDTQFQAEDFDFDDSELAMGQYATFLRHFQVAIEGAGGDGTTFQAICKGRDLGLTPETTFQMVCEIYNPRCQPEWDLPALEIKTGNVYKYASGGVGAQNYSNMLGKITAEVQADMDHSANSEGVLWAKDKHGHPLANDEDNIINFLTVKCHGTFQHACVGLFRFNELSQEIEFTRFPPWFDPEHAKGVDPLEMPQVLTDEHISNFKRFLSQCFGYKASREVIYAGIEHAARRFSYHPIKVWLKHLRWDGVPRLETWMADYLGAEDNELNSAMGAAVLCGAVSRAMHPGQKWDYVLTLEGPQGSMKSAVCETLAVNPSWFASLQPDTDKDTRMAFGRKWIIELAEIDSLSRRDAAQVKAFITTQVDTMRVPYGKLTRDYHRQSICIGTVNPNASGEYLVDPTGNRRYWPVRCGVIDIEGLTEARAQLYAEAVVRYKAIGSRALYLTGVAEAMARSEVKKREKTDPFESMLTEWFEANPDVEHATFTHLAINALGLTTANMTQKVRDRMLTSAAHLGCEVIGKGRDVMRAPDFHPLQDMEPFYDELPNLIHQLRARITQPIEIGSLGLYGMLTDTLEPELVQEQKQSFTRKVKNLPGVEGTGLRGSNGTLLRIKPLSLEEKYPV